ncbi:hypothetical protein J2741_000544 [Methanolinea mesophila]|uniref:alpha/beta hydrolase n=1 Tax=Methanolinea mesophila TaxID=547055 RepID=UPI001FD82F8E|nr:alpha/beta hydrolase [Methanolinea mesophila]MBP1927997.1 hypothetical protein [Methanolinea mesophila]
MTKNSDMEFPGWPSGSVLLIEGSASFLVVGLAGARFPLCIETMEEEYCETVDAHHLIAVSAPEGGDYSPALMLMELVRSYRFPLVVLPRNHPGSRRLRYVVSAGPEILLSCGISRGTHPEQHLLCSSPELAGITLLADEKKVTVRNIPSGITAGVRALPLHDRGGVE